MCHIAGCDLGGGVWPPLASRLVWSLLAWALYQPLGCSDHTDKCGCLQAVVEGQEACATLQDAISVVEFAAIFGKQTGLSLLRWALCISTADSTMSWRHLDCAQAVVEGQEACATLQDAISVVEFAATFGKQTGLEPLGLGALHQAAAWPLDSPQLGALYLTLTRCLCNDQVRELLSDLCFGDKLSATLSFWAPRCGLASETPVPHPHSLPVQ